MCRHIVPQPHMRTASPSYNRYGTNCLTGTRFSYNKSSPCNARVPQRESKHKKQRHALVHGPSLGLGYKHIRPDRPHKRKTAKDEADITAQVCFVWVHATRSKSRTTSVEVRGRHPTYAQIGNDSVREYTTQEAGPDGDTGRLGTQLGRRDFRRDHIAQRCAVRVRQSTSDVHTRSWNKQLTCRRGKQSCK